MIRRHLRSQPSAPHPQVNQANGNGVLALLLTAGTNLLGIVTTPFFFKALVASKGASGGASLDPVSLLSKLLLSVLMPLVVGKVRPFSCPFHHHVVFVLIPLVVGASPTTRGLCTRGLCPSSVLASHFL